MIRQKYSFLLSWFLALAFVPGCSQRADDASSDASVPADTLRRVTLVFAGDLMQHGPQINAARTSSGSYDYAPCFEAVRSHISSYDLAIANFETTLGGAPYSGYPQFCSPDAYLFAVRDAGFDIIETSNNHSADTHRRGIERTIKMLDSLGLSHLGTYVDRAARADCYPLMVEKNGIRIAFLNFTYDTNGIPVPSPNVVNLIDKEEIAADIRRARELGADVIIACPHWGIEYATVQSHAQEELADWLFSQGVTHIIGGHPHVVQPIEVRTDSAGGRHLLAYSLGNFISNQSKPNTDGGLMVQLVIEKDSVVRLADCSYSLTWVSRPVVSGQRNYRILPVSYPQDKLRPEERRRMEVYARNVRALFSKHNKGRISELPVAL